MRILPAIPLLALGLALPVSAHDHTPPPVRPAQSYAAVEVHPQEKVAIAAEPYDTREKEAIFRVDYLSHGIMPVLLTITNMGDRPISLSDARILFETSDGQTIQAAEPEDVLRTMTRKERQGGRVPMPGPIPAIHLKPKGSMKEIQADFNEFEYQALVVEPHTTHAGFLFYVIGDSDIAGVKYPLSGAHLYVREIHNADGKDLFSFEVPFDKYLQSKSNQMH
ncbi:MAG: hypothetical protein ACRD3N_07225 [Terracidiphilus sp.]